MTSKAFILLTLSLTIAFVSCNKATPAGFWKSYKKDLLIKNISDQGPYGGHRAMYWNAGEHNTFSSNTAIEFASKNGWSLVDSLEFNQKQTNTWTYDKQAIFPLTSTGFSDTIENNSQLEYFPRWFGGKLKVYRFKTGWITIEPGTDDSIEENGFVVINADRTQMAVYHLWGE